MVDPQVRDALVSVLVAEAARLALKGDREAARDLLLGLGPEESLPVEALDLLAKLSAQSGDLDEAERLWRLALALEPGSKDIAAALRRVQRERQRPPWLPGRVALLTMTAGMLCAAVVAAAVAVPLTTGESGAPERSDSQGAQPVGGSSPTASPTHSPSAPATSASPSPSPTPTGGQTPAHPPELAGLLASLGSVSGIEIRNANTAEPEIVFARGLFPAGSASLPETARRRLRRVSVRLKRWDDGLVFTVVGQTDDLRPSGKGRYKTNDEIALARAGAVAEAFIRDGVAPSSILVSTRGAADPPFKNDSAAGRAKNRTVVVLVKVRP